MISIMISYDGTQLEFFFISITMLIIFLFFSQLGKITNQTKTQKIPMLDFFQQRVKCFFFIG